MDSRFRAAVEQARKSGDLYFAGMLSKERITTSLRESRAWFQGWVYSGPITVWVFLSQCLSSDHSCREAVAKLIAWRVKNGQSACSADTSAYCTARDQLPEKTCRDLALGVGRESHQQAPESWLWKTRRVILGDGSTFTMADTEANQKEYPQQSGQKSGCGFPIMRALVLFSLAVGSVIEAAISPYSGKQTGENSLLRTLHSTLQEGDVLVLDRYFSGWFDIALLQQKGVDVVVRKHQLRATDFRSGQRLGKDDQLVCWSKPQKPTWMDSETYHSLPDSLRLREVRVRVTQPGFRTRTLVVVTTLLDSDEYTHHDLATVFRLRWHAELNLRSLKIVMQMDHLRCKEPHRVRNEFYMHLLAYNLIRQVMAEAAQKTDVSPHEISFKGTMQTLNQFLPMLSDAVSLDHWYDSLLEAIATHIVANRPDRIEPRCRKRRPKKFKNLREHRSVYKNRFRSKG
jgi:hypothetical protein